MDFADYPGHVRGAQSIKLQEKKSLKVSILYTLHYIHTTPALHSATLTLLSILHTLTMQQPLLMQAKPDVQKYILNIFRKIFCLELTTYY